MCSVSVYMGVYDTRSLQNVFWQMGRWIGCSFVDHSPGMFARICSVLYMYIYMYMPLIYCTHELLSPGMWLIHGFSGSFVDHEPRNVC